jgi:hypothetical protein
MTTREEELRAALESSDDETVIEAAIALCQEILFVNQDYIASETVLLEAIGRQSSKDGNVIEVLLGELYIHIDEIPRAKRFLNRAAASSKDDVKKKASELQMSIENR